MEQLGIVHAQSEALQRELASWPPLKDGWVYLLNSSSGDLMYGDLVNNRVVEEATYKELTTEEYGNGQSAAAWVPDHGAEAGCALATAPTGAIANADSDNVYLAGVSGGFERASRSGEATPSISVRLLDTMAPKSPSLPAPASPLLRLEDSPSSALAGGSAPLQHITPENMLNEFPALEDAPASDAKLQQQERRLADLLKSLPE